MLDLEGPWSFSSSMTCCYRPFTITFCMWALFPSIFPRFISYSTCFVVSVFIVCYSPINCLSSHLVPHTSKRTNTIVAFNQYECAWCKYFSDFFFFIFGHATDWLYHYIPLVHNFPQFPSQLFRSFNSLDQFLGSASVTLHYIIL